MEEIKIQEENKEEENSENNSDNNNKNILERGAEKIVEEVKEIAEKIEEGVKKVVEKVEGKKEVDEEEEEVEEDKDEKKEEGVKSSLIFVIKVTTNKEDRALELISTKVHKKDLNVYSLARPHGLKGYLFLEAKDRDSAEEAAYNLPYVKGIIGKTLEYEEIKNMIEPVMEEINIEKGDIVEIIGDPFKKEKAKVVRVDKNKGEVVVTLLAAVVSIPVTVKLDNVKVIRREKEEGSEDDGSETKEVKAEEKQEDSTPLGESAEPEIKEDEERGGLLIPDDY